MARQDEGRIDAAIRPRLEAGMDRAVSRGLALSLPNVLTYLRILAVPALVVSLTLVEGDSGRWLAFALFVSASLTDWLDGYLARMWAQQSTLGQMLDPIADKLLVGAALIMLVHDRTIDGFSVWAAVIVLCREILVSGLREFLASLNVTVRVTRLAKWKTAVQMVALAVLLIAPAMVPYHGEAATFGIGCLWAAALLTLWTGYDYLKAALLHAVEW
jgi:CDP-diacylglycerol--glycerol-3-phosphate 3-phosphatidyltransferase/cardiolipin synthase